MTSSKSVKMEATLRTFENEHFGESTLPSVMIPGKSQRDTEARGGGPKNFSGKVPVIFFQIRRKQHGHRHWVIRLLYQDQNQYVLLTPPNVTPGVPDVHVGATLGVRQSYQGPWIRCHLKQQPRIVFTQEVQHLGKALGNGVGAWKTSCKGK